MKLQPTKSFNPAFAILAFIASISISMHAQAYYTFLDNGDILSDGQVEAAGGVQIGGGDLDGSNILGHLDLPYNNESNMRIGIGAGETDYFASFLFKYSPIPDVDQQPALGVVAGATVATDEGDALVALHLKLFGSKIFETEIGRLNAYSAISASFLTYDGETSNPGHLIFGSEWKKEASSQHAISAEVGLDVVDAFGYIAAVYTFNFAQEDLKVERN